MDPLWHIAWVLLLAGLVGGLVNYVLASATDDILMAFWKHLAVGVAASFMVPLFLNMISADLIDKIRGSSAAQPDYSKLFVLAGFSLVASISSRAFIQSVSARLLQEVKDANRKAEAAEANAAEAKAAVVPLVEQEVAADSPSFTEQARLASSQDFSQEELHVLRALLDSPYTLRSLTGIAKDSGLERAAVNMTLGLLIDKNFVGQSTGTHGAPRWYATAAARALATKR